MIPTVIGSVILAAIFILIVARHFYNKKHGKHSCSCGGGCGSCTACDQAKARTQNTNQA